MLRRKYHYQSSLVSYKSAFVAENAAINKMTSLGKNSIKVYILFIFIAIILSILLFFMTVGIVFISIHYFLHFTEDFPITPVTKIGNSPPTINSAFVPDFVISLGFDKIFAAPFSSKNALLFL